MTSTVNKVFLVAVCIVSLTIAYIECKSAADAGIFPHQNPSKGTKSILGLEGNSGAIYCHNNWLRNNIVLNEVTGPSTSQTQNTIDLYEASGPETLAAVQLHVDAVSITASQEAAFKVAYALVVRPTSGPAPTYADLYDDSAPYRALYEPKSNVVYAKGMQQDVDVYSQSDRLEIHYNSACDPSIENIQLTGGDKLQLVIMVKGITTATNGPELSHNVAFGYQNSFP